MLSSRHWTFINLINNVGKNYYTDMGFVQRIENYDAARDTVVRMGFKTTFAMLSYEVMPEKGKIGKFNTSLNQDLVLNPDNSFNESNTKLTFRTQYKNTSGIDLTVSNSTTNLLFAMVKQWRQSHRSTAYTKVQAGSICTDRNHPNDHIMN